VTKDRRLGRGLAALLGNPLEGDEGLSPVQSPVSQGDDGNRGQVAEHMDAIASTEQTRTQTIAALAAQAKQSVDVSADQTQSIPIRSQELQVDQIDPNPFQPRRQFNTEEIASLAESIRTHQQIQPILVRRVGDRYQLISGERRLRATIHAGLKSIRAEIREADDRLVSELAIIENLQRKDLNAIEKALSFRRYLDEHQCTQEELANRLSLDRTTITNAMRLLELPSPIIEMVQHGELTGGHAKPLLALGAEAQQIELAKQVILEGWSVRAVERRVAELVHDEDESDAGLATAVANSRKKRPKDNQLAALEQQMKMGLGTKVEIQRTSRGRGKIVVHFTSLEEFDRLHSQFCGKANKQAA
jgi:ParB family chromosome partitioning protein